MSSIGRCCQPRPTAWATARVTSRARFYWAEVGRFVQQDPVRDGMNWYAYAEGNPVARIDPTGEVAPLVVVCAATAYKTYTTLMVTANISLTFLTANACRDCKARAGDMCRRAKQRLDADRYHEWRRIARPGEKCREVCGMALDFGQRTVFWAGMRLAPHVLRARPPWVAPRI